MTRVHDLLRKLEADLHQPQKKDVQELLDTLNALYLNVKLEGDVLKLSSSDNRVRNYFRKLAVLANEIKIVKDVLHKAGNFTKADSEINRILAKIAALMDGHKIKGKR